VHLQFKINIIIKTTKMDASLKSQLEDMGFSED